MHLLQDVGKIPLADATLIEEPNDSDREDEGKLRNRNYSNRMSVIGRFLLEHLCLFLFNLTIGIKFKVTEYYFLHGNADS